MSALRQGAFEALCIFLAASVLGFAFTYITQRGHFAPSASILPLPASAGEIPPMMINIQEAQELFGSGHGLFIDTRNEFDFKLGHIKGAINIPLKDFDEKRDVLAKLPRDRSLITYCDGAECNSSIELASKLHLAGFSGVKIFFEGWNTWKANELPTETLR